MQYGSIVNSKDDSYNLRKGLIKKNKVRRSKSLDFELSLNMATFNMDHAFKIIPEFNGNRDKLHKFICCCDISYKTVQKTDEKTFLDIVKVKLIDAAYDIVKYNNYKTWEELKVKINSEFGECRSVSQIQFELVGIKQIKSEEIRTYASRVQKLLSELNDACIKSEGSNSAQAIRNLNSKIGLRCFEEGLWNHSIKLLVKASKFENIGEAIERACAEEVILNHRNRNFSENSHKTKSNANFQRFNSLFMRNASSYANSSVNSTSYQQNTSPNSNSSHFNKPHSSRNVLICAYCKYQGHHISECRKKRYADSQNLRKSTAQPSENLIGLGQPTSNTAVRVQDLKK